MKLIDKKDLLFMDGMFVNPDNKVIAMNRLADEVNEIVDLAELIEFAKTNRSKIEAATGKPIVFTPTKSKAPCLTLGKTVAMPLDDELAAQAQARANEWLAKNAVDDIDQHLARYSYLADWFSKDYITTNDHQVSEMFKTNPLDLTESFVINTVEAFHDADINQLIKGITIGH